MADSGNPGPLTRRKPPTGRPPAVLELGSGQGVVGLCRVTGATSCGRPFMLPDNEDDERMPGTECVVIPLRARGSTSPALDRAAQGRIGEQLRAMYGALTEAPIPERLLALLDRLDASGRGAINDR